MTLTLIVVGILIWWGCAMQLRRFHAAFCRAAAPDLATETYTEVAERFGWETCPACGWAPLRQTGYTFACACGQYAIDVRVCRSALGILCCAACRWAIPAELRVCYPGAAHESRAVGFTTRVTLS